MNATIKPQYRTTLHRDGSVSYWNVYRQQWARQPAGQISDQDLASMGSADRERVATIARRTAPELHHHMQQYRYEFRRNGRVIRTRWADQDTARQRMQQRIGEFHEPGRVAGDGDSAADGSHPGAPRNGGLLSREVRIP